MNQSALDKDGETLEVGDVIKVREHEFAPMEGEITAISKNGQVKVYVFALVKPDRFWISPKCLELISRGG